MTIIRFDTSVVDSGHTSRALAASVWSDLAAVLGVRVLRPSTSQRAAVGEQTVEDERLSAFFGYGDIHRIVLSYWKHS